MSVVYTVTCHVVWFAATLHNALIVTQSLFFTDILVAKRSLLYVSHLYYDRCIFWIPCYCTSILRSLQTIECVVSLSTVRRLQDELLVEVTISGRRAKRREGKSKGRLCLYTIGTASCSVNAHSHCGILNGIALSTTVSSNKQLMAFHNYRRQASH